MLISVETTIPSSKIGSVHPAHPQVTAYNYNYRPSECGLLDSKFKESYIKTIILKQHKS